MTNTLFIGKLWILAAISAILLTSPQLLNLIPVKAAAQTIRQATVQTSYKYYSGSVPCNTESGDNSALTFYGYGISSDGTSATINRGEWTIESSNGRVLYSGLITGNFSTSQPQGVHLSLTVNTDNCNAGAPDVGSMLYATCGSYKTGIHWMWPDIQPPMGDFVGNVQCTISQSHDEMKLPPSPPMS